MFNIFKPKQKPSNLTRDYSQPDHLATAKWKLRNLVAAHIRTLALKRVAGITVDDYGNVDGTKWNEEAQYFFDKVLRPSLSIEEARAIADAGISNIAQELLEEPVRIECGRMHASGEYDMTVRKLHPISGNITPSPRSRPKPLERAGGLTGVVSRGLIIREEPLNRILSGSKTWEMRSSPTKVRGTVALIKKGSKAIFGVADIVDSRGPLSRAEMLSSVPFHGIAPERLDDPEISAWRCAWVLKNVRRLPCPINYIHKGGAVIFVTLDEFAISELARFLGEH